MSQMTDINGREIPNSPCPVCGYPCDAVTDMSGEDKKPAPFDITICAKCGEILMFGQDMKLEIPTLHVLMQANADGMKLLEKFQRFVREQRPMG